jgi:hypothetical protein
VSEIIVIERVALFAQLLNHRLHIDGIPENDCIDDQIQAACLINLLFFQVAANFALIGKVDKLSKVMQLLAFVEL